MGNNAKALSSELHQIASTYYTVTPRQLFRYRPYNLHVIKSFFGPDVFSFRVFNYTFILIISQLQAK